MAKSATYDPTAAAIQLFQLMSPRAACEILDPKATIDVDDGNWGDSHVVISDRFRGRQFHGETSAAAWNLLRTFCTRAMRSMGVDRWVEAGVEESGRAASVAASVVPKAKKADPSRYEKQPKLSKEEALAADIKRKEANRKARLAYARKTPVKKGASALTKYHRRAEERKVLEADPVTPDAGILGPFGTLYDQINALPKEKLVAMLVATMVVQKVIK